MMGKPMKVKFINKKGEWVEELCHDPSTCREHKRKVADTKKSLLAATAAADFPYTVSKGEETTVKSLHELMSIFDDTSVGDIELIEPFVDNEQLGLTLNEAKEYKKQLLEEWGVKKLKNYNSLGAASIDMEMGFKVANGYDDVFSIKEIENNARREKDIIEAPYYQNRQIYTLLSTAIDKETDPEVKEGLKSAIKWFQETQEGAPFSEGETYPASGKEKLFYINGLDYCYMLEYDFGAAASDASSRNPELKKGWSKAVKALKLYTEKLAHKHERK